MKTQSKRIKSLYHCWLGMVQRCTYKQHRSYECYGGRGITVCDDWRNFERFVMDIVKEIGFKPTDKHTLDRIDNDGDYAPGNVRWATRLQQVQNRRRFRNNKSGHTGVSWDKPTGKWRVQKRVSGIKKSIGYFEDIEEARRAYDETRT